MVDIFHGEDRLILKFKIKQSKQMEVVPIKKFLILHKQIQIVQDRNAMMHALTLASVACLGMAQQLHHSSLN